MRAWWSRLIGSPRALAAVGVGLVVVVAAVAALLVASGDDDTSPAAAAATPSAGASSAAPEEAGPSAKAPRTAPTVLPPDKDVYCPAFDKIRGGGLTTPGDDEEAGADLAELSRTFDGLLARYGKAASVAPLSLRDDYAQALGYLRQGKKATDSQDLGLLKALVSNLDSLNDSMTSIQAKSAQFCG